MSLKRHSGLRTELPFELCVPEVLCSWLRLHVSLYSIHQTEADLLPSSWVASATNSTLPSAVCFKVPVLLSTLYCTQPCPSLRCLYGSLFNFSSSDYRRLGPSLQTEVRATVNRIKLQALHPACTLNEVQLGVMSCRTF